MNRASNVLAAPMVYCTAWKFSVKSAVAAMLIRGNQAHFIRHGFAHEGLNQIGARIGDHSGDDIALALYGSKYDLLARASATPKASV